MLRTPTPATPAKVAAAATKKAKETYNAFNLTKFIDDLLKSLSNLIFWSSAIISVLGVSLLFYLFTMEINLAFAIASGIGFVGLIAYGAILLLRSDFRHHWSTISEHDQFIYMITGYTWSIGLIAVSVICILLCLHFIPMFLPLSFATGYAIISTPVPLAIFFLTPLLLLLCPAGRKALSNFMHDRFSTKAKGIHTIGIILAKLAIAVIVVLSLTAILPANMITFLYVPVGILLGAYFLFKIPQYISNLDNNYHIGQNIAIYLELTQLLEKKETHVNKLGEMEMEAVHISRALFQEKEENDNDAKDKSADSTPIMPKVFLEDVVTHVLGM